MAFALFPPPSRQLLCMTKSTTLVWWMGCRLRADRLLGWTEPWRAATKRASAASLQIGQHGMEGPIPLASPEGLWPHSLGARRGLWLVPSLLTQNFRRPVRELGHCPCVQPGVTSLCLLRAGFVTKRKRNFNREISSKLRMEMPPFRCS